MKRLKIALVSIALALVALELGARVWLGDGFVQGAWVGPPQALCGRFDPVLGWANREGASARIAGPCGVYDVTIDEHGRRTGSGAVRAEHTVVLLGDSTAWGWGVDSAHTFASVVERELPGVRIVNLAVPGYSTDQQLLCFQEAGVEDADLVLLALVHNDLVANRHPEFHGMQKPQLVRAPDGGWSWINAPVPRPGEDSDLARRYGLRVASTYLATLKLLLPPPPKYQRPDLARPDVRAAIERYWNDLIDPASVASALLERLRDAVDASGAELHAFVLPHLHDRYLYDPTWPVPEGVDDEGFRTYGSQRLAECGERLGFPTFSVDEALLRTVRTGENLDCGDEHLNAAGNQVVGVAVAEYLRRVLGR